MPNLIPIALLVDGWRGRRLMRRAAAAHAAGMFAVPLAWCPIDLAGRQRVSYGISATLQCAA